MERRKSDKRPIEPRVPPSVGSERGALIEEASSASADPWKIKHRRRVHLILQKHERSLSDEETAELAALEVQFSARLKEVAPRSREVLDEFSDYVATMRAKVAAKKTGIER